VREKHHPERNYMTRSTSIPDESKACSPKSQRVAPESDMSIFPPSSHLAEFLYLDQEAGIRGTKNRPLLV